MSWGQFGKNFAAAVPAGVAWGEGAAKGANRRAFTDAGAILAEAQEFDPWAALKTGAPALPVEGESPVEAAVQGDVANAAAKGGGALPVGNTVSPKPDVAAPARKANQGFDGNTWQSYKDRYMKAISRINDPEQYSMALQRFGDIEKQRIMGYLDAAIYMAQTGNAAEAQRNMLAVSAFMNPGVTPQIEYDEKSKAFMVANYQDGKPLGGYAVSLAQMQDMKHQLVDFKDWHKCAFQRDRARAADAGRAARAGAARAAEDAKLSRAQLTAMTSAINAIDGSDVRLFGPSIVQDAPLLPPTVGGAGLSFGANVPPAALPVSEAETPKLGFAGLPSTREPGPKREVYTGKAGFTPDQQAVIDRSQVAAINKRKIEADRQRVEDERAGILFEQGQQDREVTLENEQTDRANDTAKQTRAMIDEGMTAFIKMTSGPPTALDELGNVDPDSPPERLAPYAGNTVLDLGAANIIEGLRTEDPTVTADEAAYIALNLLSGAPNADAKLVQKDSGAFVVQSMASDFPISPENAQRYVRLVEALAEARKSLNVPKDVAAAAEAGSEGAIPVAEAAAPPGPPPRDDSVAAMPVQDDYGQGEALLTPPPQLDSAGPQGQGLFSRMLGGGGGFSDQSQTGVLPNNMGGFKPGGGGASDVVNGQQTRTGQAVSGAVGAIGDAFTGRRGLSDLRPPGNVEPRPHPSRGAVAVRTWNAKYGATHNPDGSPKKGAR